MRFCTSAVIKPLLHERAQPLVLHQQMRDNTDFRRSLRYYLWHCEVVALVSESCARQQGTPLMKVSKNFPVVLSVVHRYSLIEAIWMTTV